MILRQFSLRRRISIIIWDWVGTLLALYIATFVRSEFFLVESMGASYQLDLRRFTDLIAAWPDQLLDPKVFLLVLVIWPFFFMIFSVYDGHKSFDRRTEIMNVLQAIFTSSLVFSGLLFFSYRGTSRGLISLFVLLDVFFLLGGRFALYFLRLLRRKNRQDLNKKVLIIGAGEIGRRTAVELTKFRTEDIDLIGFLDDTTASADLQIDGLRVLGKIADVFEVAKTHPFQHAIVALPLRADQRLLDLVKKLQASGISAHIVPDLFALSFPRASLDGFSGISVINVGTPGIYGNQRVFKRIFDVLFSLACLLTLSPLLILIAVLIRLDSSGSVLFRQKRIGENGQPFELLKFRSMRIDSDEKMHREYMTRLIKGDLEPDQTDSNQNGSLKKSMDPRITRLGKFIRKYSLDELPQFINVIRGDMSLVGPRPPIPYEVEVYEDWHMRRLEAMPGITGLWQVKARNQVSFDEMVRLDIEYIDNYSFWMDIKLILLTPWAMIHGKGAG